jgi:hypothetical protein
MVDNNYILYDDEIHYLIKCPNYDNKVIINSLRNIPERIINKYYKILSIYFLNMVSENVFEFYQRYVSILLNEYNLNKVNYVEDKFWRDLLSKFKREIELI